MKTRIFVTRTDDNVSHTLHLPAMENEIQQSCDNLNIPNNMKSKVRVTEVVDDEPLNRILSGNEYNIEELNFLMKSLDRYTDLEADTFYATATALKATDIKDLINLSFSTESYNLIDDLSDLDSLGKELYLKEHGGVNIDELKAFDGKAYVEQMIANNPKPLISPYGLIYPTEHEPYTFYQSKAFPVYLNGVNIIQGLLKTDTAEELLDLPFEQSTLAKAMERLEIDTLEGTSFEVMECVLPANIESIVMQEKDDLNALNQMTKQLEEIGKREYEYLSQLVAHTEVRDPEDLSLLMGSIHEFELFPNIHTAEEYGRYMICDSGRFEYDENLEEFIDFKGYGNHRLKMENGAFTNTGYLLYHGYNQALSDILSNVGIEVPHGQTEELRLYMPLKVISYQEENDWGHYETTDCEEELDSCELLQIEDNLRAKMAEYSQEDGKRGLMEYYDNNSSVSAKVESLRLDFEEVNGDLFGIAVLNINAQLTNDEWADIREYITGQCSDGAGESFEQREFNLDGREVYVSFWSSDDDWYIKTAEEMGFAEPIQGFEMKMT